MNEAELIFHEIERMKKTSENMDKIIIVKINCEEETDEKSYEFQAYFDDELESIESTYNIGTLNQVLKMLLNADYFLDFEIEVF